MLRSVGLVRTDVSEERSASIKSPEILHDTRTDWSVIKQL
jgi:hypothetical protein